MFDRASEPNEPTLPGFVAWLERKDPTERYHWPTAEICACGQYAKEIGVKSWLGSDEGWSKLNRLARGAKTINDYETVDGSGWTFGQLLDRCRKEMAE